MLNIYTYVKGEKQLYKLLERMRKERPRFTESFAHVDNITIERIYDKPDGSVDGYHEYFILYMPHDNGTWTIEDARTAVHKDIRNGERNMKTV